MRRGRTCPPRFTVSIKHVSPRMQGRFLRAASTLESCVTIYSTLFHFANLLHPSCASPPRIFLGAWENLPVLYVNCVGIADPEPFAAASLSPLSERDRLGKAWTVQIRSDFFSSLSCLSIPFPPPSRPSSEPDGETDPLADPG